MVRSRTKHPVIDIERWFTRREATRGKEFVVRIFNTELGATGPSKPVLNIRLDVAPGTREGARFRLGSITLTGSAFADAEYDLYMIVRVVNRTVIPFARR